LHFKWSPFLVGLRQSENIKPRRSLSAPRTLSQCRRVLVGREMAEAAERLFEDSLEERVYLTVAGDETDIPLTNYSTKEYLTAGFFYSTVK